MNLEITITDLFNVVLLVVGLNLMYRGIEISHPVFGVLFCNLIVALSTSITEILAVETVSNIRVTTIAGCFTAALVHFHCCCWCILSILRYLYIVHSDWLISRCPQSNRILLISLLTIFTMFFILSAYVFGIVIYFGWPYTEVYEMDLGAKLTCVACLLSSYFLLLGISCFFYIILLRRKGAAGINRVGNEIQMVRLFEINFTVRCEE